VPIANYDDNKPLTNDVDDKYAEGSKDDEY
jgi:hypothetical protein